MTQIPSVKSPYQASGFAPEAPHPTARLEATFARVRGRTQIVRSFHSAPLKIARAFPHTDSGVGVCTMDCSPGMLSGDFYAFSYHLEPGARVHLTNQSFTKVHPSSQAPSRQLQEITLENDAWLEYMPEPVMLYAQADFHNECRVEVGQGATLLLSDLTTAGRISRGEAFGFQQWRNSLQLNCDGELLVCNRMMLRPQQFSPHQRGAWGKHTSWGNFYVVATALSPQRTTELIEQLRVALASIPSVLSGVSALEKNGIAVSLLGSRTWDLQQVVANLRSATRSYLTALQPD